MSISNEQNKKIILYDENGNKKYEGEIKNNKYEGKGIKYNKKGNKIYEGFFKNGKPEGKGIGYYENGNKKYEGSHKNGKPEGKGIIYEINGNKYYEGDFKNGIWEGKGIKYYKNGNKKYEGDYKNNIAEGKGINYYENGNKEYEGDFKSGNWEGKGVKYYENGNKIYEGDYKNGIVEGKGISYYENGNKEYEGNFEKGKWEGKGILYDQKGYKIYEGNFKNGIWEGKGVKYYENGNKKYEGDYKSGVVEGKGISYYENGNKEYEGDFKNGNWEGKGIKYYENGNKQYEGYFKDGKFEEKGIIFYENGEKEYIKDFKIKSKEIRFYKNGKIDYATIFINGKIEKIKDKFNFIYDDNNFIEIDYISKGAYGEIYKAYSIKDEKEVCLKKINLDNMKKAYNNYYLEYIYREIHILKSLNKYKSSIHYYGDYDSNNEKIIILEKCDINLREYIEKDKKIFDIKDIKVHFKDLNEVFYYMQKNSIIHRDLKLENILVKYINKEKNIIILKLTDYGTSKIINNTFSGPRGTSDYIAPEILLDKIKEYKSSVDIFSLGVILYQISHKLNHPFKRIGNDYLEFTYLNLYEKDNYKIEFDKSIKDANFKDLINKMLKLKPENRLTWEEYFNHKFFKNN